MSKNLLVIGGAGFLGKNLVESVDKSEWDVTVVDYKGKKGTFRNVDLEQLDSSDDILDMALKMPTSPKVVFMASKIGSREFETNGIELGHANVVMHTIFHTFLSDYKKKTGKSLDVSFFSTSEVYGDCNGPETFLTTESKLGQFPGNVPRFSYALEKMSMEKSLHLALTKGTISRLSILRPFNVSGRYQRRGVLYSMVKAGLRNGTIEYAENTTRTITPVTSAIPQMLGAIFSEETWVTKNIVDPLCSLTMVHLAEIVARHLNERHHRKCKLRKVAQDKYIRYRQVSSVDSFSDIDNYLSNTIEDVVREVFAQ